MFIRLLIFFILNLADLVLTCYGTSTGIGTEINPVMNFLLTEPIMFLMVKLFVPLLACCFLYNYKNDRRANIASWIIMIIFAVVVSFNIIMLFIL